MSLEANVDAEEIEKFQSIASRWWDPQSEFKPLHDINPLRLDYIERQTGSIDTKRVLDIGCGGGILAEALAQKGALVSAIDMAQQSLDVAKMHRLESGLEIDYQLSTAEAFAQQHGAQFDIVTCLEMLEHVPHPESVVAAAAKLVKPGGQVIFSTINRNPKSFLLAILGAEYILRLIPRGTHDYKKLIKPSELAAAARSNGMQVKDICGIAYNPISRNYRLAHDIDVNYLMACSLDD